MEKNTESDIFKFENVCLENSKKLGTTSNFREQREQQVILGIAIDNKLTFDGHIKSICQKTSQKMSALSTILPYLETNKKELVFKSIVRF